jgi:hypothetical protein
MKEVKKMKENKEQLLEEIDIARKFLQTSIWKSIQQRAQNAITAGISYTPTSFSTALHTIRTIWENNKLLQLPSIILNEIKNIENQLKGDE